MCSSDLPLQYLVFRLFHLLSTIHTYPLISRVCFGVAFGSLKFKSPAFLARYSLVSPASIDDILYKCMDDDAIAIFDV